MLSTGSTPFRRALDGQVRPRRNNDAHFETAAIFKSLPTPLRRYCTPCTEDSSGLHCHYVPSTSFEGGPGRDGAGRHLCASHHARRGAMLVLIRQTRARGYGSPKQLWGSPSRTGEGLASRPARSSGRAFPLADGVRLEGGARLDGDGALLRAARDRRKRYGHRGA